MNRANRLEFPEGKSFAFTIFDDTDNSSVANVSPVYNLLHQLGFRTTKSVWPLAPTQRSYIGGSTLVEPDYLQFVLSLRDKGFEIGFHNATSHDCTRELTLKGLDTFRELIGEYPKVHCNHANNRENMYWGRHRLSTLVASAVYRLANVRRTREFFGHEQDSEFFWGDLCREHTEYVRNLVFREINLRNINPTMPYHDPRRPYVNWWFSSTEAANVSKFCQILEDDQLDRLEAEGGVCILYTHFASGFATESGVSPEFATVMQKLSRRNGWFAPVGELLDWLKPRTGGMLPSGERLRMEMRWLKEKLLHGAS